MALCSRLMGCKFESERKSAFVNLVKAVAELYRKESAHSVFGDNLNVSRFVGRPLKDTRLLDHIGGTFSDSRSCVHISSSSGDLVCRYGM